MRHGPEEDTYGIRKAIRIQWSVPGSHQRDRGERRLQLDQTLCILRGPREVGWSLQSRVHRS